MRTKTGMLQPTSGAWFLHEFHSSTHGSQLYNEFRGEKEKSDLSEEGPVFIMQLQLLPSQPSGRFIFQDGPSPWEMFLPGISTLVPFNLDTEWEFEGKTHKRIAIG